MQLLGREIGLDQPLFLIAGPCVVRSLAIMRETSYPVVFDATDCV
jgi:3-deoxy-D-manno-octulosonic acid (KDO) 8-phosphate synthase